MKPIALLLALLLAGGAGWYANSKFSTSHSTHGTGGESGQSGTASRKILFYQSPMHPWIRSDKPGKCTVCGMDLVPVFDGDSGGADHGLSLASNSVVAIGVQTAEVRRQSVDRTLRFSGTIDDDDSRHRILSAYVEGRIDALFLHHEGAEIAAGDRLATFYSAPLLAAVREYLSLRTHSNPSTTTASALVDGARTRLRQLGLTPEQIETLPATVTPDTLSVDIRSPMSGVVVKRIAYAGQYVKEGDPLFELADFSVMWLKFDAYERDLAWLQRGQTVEVATPALPGMGFTNQIRFIDPNLDPASATAKVRVELPNPLLPSTNNPGTPRQRLLRHRLTAEVRVRASIPDRLAIPRSAVLNPGGKPRVFVELTPGRYALRPVQLGRVGDSLVEVVAGLNPGERVVTQGGFMIDAQAQLSTLGDTSQDASTPAAAVAMEPAVSSVSATPAAATVTPTPTTLTNEQRSSLRAFVVAADAVGRALAEDELHVFHGRLDALRSAAAAVRSIPGVEAAKDVASLIPTAANAGNTLPEARRAFHPLSQRLVEITRQLRTRVDGFEDVRMFECPMTRRAFPDAPAKASWIQLDRVQHNPWFGKEMPDCGTELKP